MNRFDLEESIMNQWSIKEDIDDLIHGILEQGMSADEIVNVLMGISVLINIKGNKSMDILEGMIRDGQI